MLVGAPMESLLPFKSQLQWPDVLCHLSYQHSELKYILINTALFYEVQKFSGHSLGLTLVSHYY